MHPISLVSTASLEEGGRTIANLRYDGIIVVLLAMQAELKSQAAKDQVRGRSQLSSLGKQTAVDLGIVINDVRALLKCSRPYLADNFKVMPCLVVD